MKYVILQILLFFFLSSFSQKNDKQLAIDSKGYFVDGIFRLISSPKINWLNEKREIGIGPTFMLASLVATSTNNKPKLVGIQAHYKYFPNGNKNRINLFLFEEITLQIIDDSWRTNEWNEDILRYQSFEYINREFLGLSNLGYGILLKINENWVINQSIGLGVYYSFSDSDEKSPNAPELFNEDENINGYKELGFTYGINFGVSYSL